MERLVMDFFKAHYDWLVAPVPTWMFIGFVFVWAAHALRIDAAWDRLSQLIEPNSLHMQADKRWVPARRWPWRRTG